MQYEGSSEQPTPDTLDFSMSKSSSANLPSSSTIANNASSKGSIEGYTSKGRKYTYRSRTPGTKRVESRLAARRRESSKRGPELLHTDWVCCKRIKCVNVIDPVASASAFRRYVTLNQIERKRALQGLMQADKSFRFEGVRICQNFIIHILSFSDSLIGAVRGRKSARATPTPNPAPRFITKHTKKREISVFIKSLAEKVGDKMPNTNNTFLPQHQKSDVYEMFRSESVSRNEQGAKISMASQSYFLKVWASDFPVIKPRPHHMFTKCNDCEFFREEKAKRGLTTAAAAVLNEAHKRHVKFVERERLEYAMKRDYATREPNTYCSMVVDGADQSAFGLPHFVHRTKSMRGESIKVRLIGIKEHLVTPKISLFLLTEEHETGANHVIEAIHRCLTEKSRKGALPKVFYLQADNCTRENKNRYMLGYLQLLVAKGVFQEVNLSFLPIGHTHEDIDQVFSRTSQRLKHHDAVTMKKMIDELHISYNPRPYVSRMKEIANFSGLCEQEDCLYSLQSWTHQRYFRIVADEGESRSSPHCIPTKCYSKLSCTDEWLPMNEGKGFLRTVPDLKRTPSTTAKCPENLEEVNKFLTSVEERVRNVQNMKELYLLRDEIYQNAEMPFHWTRSDMIELNGRFLRHSGGNGQSSDDDDPEMAELNDMFRHTYDYERGDMVAVKADDDNFWIGEVLDVNCTESNVAETLSINWYESCGKSQQSPHTASYKPAYLERGTGKRKTKEPWTDNISVNCVLVRFSKLNSNKKLPVAASKRIRECFN